MARLSLPLPALQFMRDTKSKYVPYIIDTSTKARVLNFKYFCCCNKDHLLFKSSENITHKGNLTKSILRIKMGTVGNTMKNT